MKKAFIRVSKWLGDIPVEAECSSCPGVKFKVNSPGHRPSREKYQQELQRDFDHHLKTAHAQKDIKIDDQGAH